MSVEIEDLLTVGLVERPINGSVLSWAEAALIAHRIAGHLDAARASDGLRTALETLARACRDSFGKCRLCGVPASTMHEDDCPVDAAIGVLEPAYWAQRRATLDAARAIPALDVELR